ncbi:MAG: hypothetical protein ACKV2T_24520 [Kofleriaceae bacterium]
MIVVLRIRDVTAAPRVGIIALVPRVGIIALVLRVGIIALVPSLGIIAPVPCLGTIAPVPCLGIVVLRPRVRARFTHGENDPHRCERGEQRGDRDLRAQRMLRRHACAFPPRVLICMRALSLARSIAMSTARTVALELLQDRSVEQPPTREDSRTRLATKRLDVAPTSLPSGRLAQHIET